MAAQEEVVITRSPPQSDGVAGMFQKHLWQPFSAAGEASAQVEPASRAGRQNDRNARRLQLMQESR
jgi:hypothetical protein